MFEALRRDGAVVVTGSPTEPGTVIESAALARPHVARLVARPDLRRQARSGRATTSPSPPRRFHRTTTTRSTPIRRAGRCWRCWSTKRRAATASSSMAGPCSIELNREHPEAIDVLARVEVGFRQYSTEADAFTRAPLVVRDRAGRFIHLRFSNQLMQPLAFDDADLAQLVRGLSAARRGDRRHRQPRVVPPQRPATRCSSTATACCTPARRTSPMAAATCKTCTSRWTTSSATWRG